MVTPVSHPQLYAGIIALNWITSSSVKAACGWVNNLVQHVANQCMSTKHLQQAQNFYTKLLPPNSWRNKFCCQILPENLVGTLCVGALALEDRTSPPSSPLMKCIKIAGVVFVAPIALHAMRHLTHSLAKPFTGFFTASSHQQSLVPFGRPTIPCLYQPIPTNQSANDLYFALIQQPFAPEIHKWSQRCKDTQIIPAEIERQLGEEWRQQLDNPGSKSEDDLIHQCPLTMKFIRFPVFVYQEQTGQRVYFEQAAILAYLDLSPSPEVIISLSVKSGQREINDGVMTDQNTILTLPISRSRLHFDQHNYKVMADKIRLIDPDAAL